MTRALLLLVAGALSLSAATRPETLDLRLEKKPLGDLLALIAGQCDAGLAVHHEVQGRLARLVTINARAATWAEAARWLADEQRLTMTLVGERLEFGDADRAFRARLVSATYDLRTLRDPATDHPAPELELAVPGGVGSRLLPPIQPESVPEVNEFIELAQRQVAPATWSIEGVSITQYNGTIVVVQVPEVQREIAGFIADLERAAARQVVFRCYRLPPGAAAEGVVLEAPAWAVLAKDLPAPAGVFQLLDEQQNHHFSGTQTAYIADADVNQEAFDPIVAIASTGLAIDATAHVTRAGVATVVRFSAASEQRFVASPIATGQGRTLLALDQPERRQDLSRDLRIIPSGGAAIYRFGDQVFALSAEVLEYTRKP